MVNAQTWLDEKFPVKTRKKFFNLEIREKDLEGFLIFNNFPNLKYLNISENRLVKIDLSECVNLEVVDAGFNQLIEVVLPRKNKITSLWLPSNFLFEIPSNLNPSTLSILGLRDNLIKADLNAFSEFVNLKKLYVGQNSLRGSLESLVNLKNLRELHILDTEVDSGLEHLSTNLERFYCAWTKFAKTLAPYLNPEYGNKDGYYYLLLWKRDNSFGFKKKINLSGNPYLSRNWRQLIHPMLTKELQKEWEENSFDYQATREWIRCGLQPTDSYYAEWLRRINKDPKWFLENGHPDTSSYFIFSHKGSLRRNKEAKVDAQVWLDQKYKKTKAENSELNINGNNLISSLEIKNWPRLKVIYNEENYLTEFTLLDLPMLKEVYLTWNPLKKLTIRNCLLLSRIDLSSNDLTDLSWLVNLSSHNLTYLNVSDNKFQAQDLTVFSSFISLEELYINSTNFTGSLKPLRNLTNLKILNVSYTKIDSGLEYLPNSLENIICADTLLKEELAPYQGNLQAWRENNRDLIEKSQSEIVSKGQSKKLKQKAKLKDLQEEINRLKLELEIKERRIEELEAKLGERTFIEQQIEQ